MTFILTLVIFRSFLRYLKKIKLGKINLKEIKLLIMTQID